MFWLPRVARHQAIHTCSGLYFEDQLNDPNRDKIFRFKMHDVPNSVSIDKAEYGTKVSLCLLRIVFRH